jgi:hypothetical protein
MAEVAWDWPSLPFPAPAPLPRAHWQRIAGGHYVSTGESTGIVVAIQGRLRRLYAVRWVQGRPCLREAPPGQVSVPEAERWVAAQVVAAHARGERLPDPADESTWDLTPLVRLDTHYAETHATLCA